MVGWLPTGDRAVLSFEFGVFMRARSLAIVGVVSLGVAACQSHPTAKHLSPIPFQTVNHMEDLGMDKNDPILIRIFKEESELEVWKRRDVDGRYALMKTYEICAWSGNLGPKHQEGDRQAPEGFYNVTPAQMNPNSSYHLSFNMGFPNAYDSSHGRTGTHLMVHGACSSAGCYAMEDEPIEEIYALAREAFRGGQREFQIHAFPFRMTPENIARHYDNKYIDFWKNLKEGNDHFEVTGQAPNVAVCGRRYVFNAAGENGRNLIPNAACPELYVPQEIEMAVAQKQAEDNVEIQLALAEIRAEENERILEQMPGTLPPLDGQPVMVAQADEQGSFDDGTDTGPGPLLALTSGRSDRDEGGLFSRMISLVSDDDDDMAAAEQAIVPSGNMLVPAEAVALPPSKPIVSAAASAPASQTPAPSVVSGYTSINQLIEAADPFAIFDRFSDDTDAKIFRD
ncbi:MAG: murein L,D-transpeptidase family protein [Pseudomonadota bacterium]